MFFGFAVAVNGGLHRLKDGEYVRAMQSINVVIQNPWFFLSFMGPVLLLPVVTFLSYGVDQGRFIILLAATILYIIGSFVLTVAGNVPLNDALAKIDSNATNDNDLAMARKNYEAPWNRLHTIRTIASIVAMILVFVTFL